MKIREDERVLTAPTNEPKEVTMSARPFVVTIAGTIHVDTTIAVMANSEEEAAKMALPSLPTWVRHGARKELE
jgi:hypothetical protein